MSNYDHLVKIVLIGDSGVGKSSVILKFVDDKFDKNFPDTIGVDFKINTITVNDKKIRLQLWDTAGQERFRTITTSYYRCAHISIVFFDLTNLTSYEDIPRWFSEIKKHADDCIYYLVGTKCDLVDRIVVTPEMIDLVCKKYDVEYIQTSALTGENIKTIFTNSVKKLLDTKISTVDTNRLVKVDVESGGNVLNKCRGWF